MWWHTRRNHISSFGERTSSFKSAGASVQSTTGSRGMRISDSNAGYTMFRGSVKSTEYPLHSPVSPSLPLPCVTVCHHVSNGLYILTLRELQHATQSKLHNRRRSQKRKDKNYHNAFSTPVTPLSRCCFRHVTITLLSICVSCVPLRLRTPLFYIPSGITNL